MSKRLGRNRRRRMRETIASLTDAAAKDLGVILAQAQTIDGLRRQVRELAPRAGFGPVPGCDVWEMYVRATAAALRGAQNRGAILADLARQLLAAVEREMGGGAAVDMARRLPAEWR